MVWFNSLREAVDSFTDKYGGDIVEEIPGTKGIGCMVVEQERKTLFESKKTRYYIVLKTETFHTFGRMFGLDEKEGTSVDARILKLAVKYPDSIIVVIFRSGAIYFMASKDWNDYVIEHKTIRRASTEILDEASVPVRMLGRMR